jgi:hypothetical protein
MEESPKSNVTAISLSATPLALFGRALLYGLLELPVISAPWAVVAFNRWLFSRLALSDGTSMEFTGKPRDSIWPVLMLIALSYYAGLVPIKFFPFIISPITILLYFLMFQWKFGNICLSNGTKSSFTGTFWQYLGWQLLLCASFITIIGWAWVQAAMFRWFCRNIKGGDYKIEFVGKGAEILWRSVVTFLACLVIIPIPWVTYWLFTWYLSKVQITKA